MYAIIDIETTGGNPRTDKITEIAVLVHDGRSVVSEYTTLVNPECRIPYYISAMTGITDEMVAGAPKFYEIARNLVELTDNRVFVAHNVSFDYGFVKSEFQRLGYDFSRERLCTVRLSRKLLPGHRSYSLGTLCSELNISINGRHRAMGDALATAELFSLLLQAGEKPGTGQPLHLSGIPSDVHPDLDPSLFSRLPELPGVYYFYNSNLELIYIGKSKNIRNRVLTHFNRALTGKAMQMRSQVADISYEVTGSELIALLQESFEIKKHKPLYNRAQRRSLFRYGLFTRKDENGYIRFGFEKITDTDSPPVVCFSTKAEALGFLNNIVDRFGLCQKLCGVYGSSPHCFHYEIGACRGACAGKELPSSYNLRAGKVLDHYGFDTGNLLIIDAGRNPEEQGAVKIENGKYIGFGYFSSRYASLDDSIIHECIMSFPDNRDVQQIIRQYLRNHRVEKLIHF